MLPSIDLRIRNLMKAMREVVVPAIPAGETLARDQALLVIGHLGMIGDQWRLAAKFENGSLQGLRALGEKLLVIGCDDALPDWRVQLQAALVAADAALPDDLAAIEAATLSLGRAIDRVISGDGSARKMNPAMMDAVLTYGEHQAMRERCWFAANGLDPDKKDLPGFLQMLSGAEIAG